MRKYISFFIVATLIFTMFAGIGGTAYAAENVDLSIDKNSVKGPVGAEFTLHATVSTDTAITGYKVKRLSDGKLYGTGDAALVSGSSNPIDIPLKLTKDMLGHDVKYQVIYTLDNGASWLDGKTFSVKVESISSDISCWISVEPDPLADANTTVELVFKIKNESGYDLENVQFFESQLSKKALKSGITVKKGTEGKISVDYKVTKDVTFKPEVVFSVGGVEQPRFSGKEKKLTVAKRQVDVFLSVDNPSPDPGQEVTFTLSVENNGNVPYTGLAVTWNGQDMEFPTTKLAAGKKYEQSYKETFSASQDVMFTITLLDHLEVLKSVNTNTVNIQLPVDPGAITSNVGLTIEPDRTALTAAGTITFTGYVSNDSGYTISNVKVTEAALGEIFSISEMETGTKQSISKTVDINESTTYNFVLTVNDRNGQAYTVNADPITVEIQTAPSPSPTDISEEADNVTLPPKNTSSDPLLIWIILAIVLLVLIIGVGVTIFVLWRRGKSPVKSSSARPSGPRPSGPRPSGPRPSGPKPSGPRPKTSLKSKLMPSGKSRNYRDRNNF